MSIVRGGKDQKEDLRMGFLGAGESEELRKGPTALLVKPESSIHC